MITQSSNQPVTLFWTVVRALLGIGQMAGAVTSLVLLIRLGPANITVISLAVTMALTVLSILLFKIVRVQS